MKDLRMTEGFKEAISPLLASCGGTLGPMLYLGKLIHRSESDDLGEILGELTENPGPILELIQTCEQTNGVLDLEGLIRHFAGFEHTQKMAELKLTVAKELPKALIPFAHTLLPLTAVDGRYYYDCGDTYVELVGLTQIGPTAGSPYAHLAALIWLPDEGLHAQILAEQAVNGVADICKGLERISYYDAPSLRESTIEGAQLLYGNT